MDKLNPRQELFVKEWLLDNNGTRAAIAAGYSERTAFTQASDLLKLPKVQKAIRAVTHANLQRIEITQDMVTTELARLAFSDMGNFVDFFTEEVIVGEDASGQPITAMKQHVYIKPSAQVDTAAIQEVTVSRDGTMKLKLYDKHKALDSLARMQGMYTDKQQVEHMGQVEYVVRFADPNEEE